MSRTKPVKRWRANYDAIIQEREDQRNQRRQEYYAREDASSITPWHRFTHLGVSGYATDEDDPGPFVDQIRDYDDPATIRDVPYREEPWKKHAQQDEELWFTDELRGLPTGQRPYATYKEDYMEEHFPFVSRKEYARPFRQRLKAQRPVRKNPRPHMMGKRPARRPSRFGGGWRTY